MTGDGRFIFGAVHIDQRAAECEELYFMPAFCKDQGVRKAAQLLKELNHYKSGFTTAGI